MDSRYVVDSASLQQFEISSRAYVRQHPDDMGARLELAWCLLAQALYQAGRETSLTTSLPHNADSETLRAVEAVVSYDAASDNARQRRSDELIGECLHQATTIQQLSLHSEDTHSAKQLQAIIGLSGGKIALREARLSLLSRALAMFQDLAQEEDAS